MKVDFEDLGLAEQLLRRQAVEHVPAMRQHLSQWGQLDASDLGLILQGLQPLNVALLDSGDKILDTVGQVYGLGAEKMANTLDAYITVEREAHNRIKELAAQMGASVGPYKDPRDTMSRLGGAVDGAGSFYGQGGDPNLFVQAFQDGYRAGEWLRDMPGKLEARGKDAVSSDRGVVEQVDVQSFLVTPTASESEIEDLRWNAGWLLGGLDWLCEQLIGFSLLEEIVFKPFAGDYKAVQKASGVWAMTADAMQGISQNTSGMLPALSEWVGKGALTFNATAAAVAQVDTVLANAASAVASVLKAFALLVRTIAIAIGKILRLISYKLARMAAEAMIPVAGWVAAGIEAVALVGEILDSVKMAYTIVNMAYDFISNMVEVKAGLVDSWMQAMDLVEALVRGGAARL